MKRNSKLSAYILRGSTAALLLSCVIVALSSAIHVPGQSPKAPPAQDNAAFGAHAATKAVTDPMVVAAGLRYPAVIDASWTATGSMGTARAQHTATLLPSGKVLVAGGFEIFPIPLSSAELYDPATGTWTATGSMSTPRSYLAAKVEAVLVSGEAAAWAATPESVET